MASPFLYVNESYFSPFQSFSVLFSPFQSFSAPSLTLFFACSLLFLHVIKHLYTCH